MSATEHGVKFRKVDPHPNPLPQVGEGKEAVKVHLWRERQAVMWCGLSEAAVLARGEQIVLSLVHCSCEECKWSYDHW